MRRINPALTFGRLAALISVLCAAASAQQPPPANKAPTGYLRVWHFASALKTPVSVSLFGGGNAKPVILGRAMIVSNAINYRDVPAGQYKLSIRTAAKDFGVSDADPEVLPSVAITVDDKSFQTVILQDDAGTAKVLLAKDTVTPADVPPGSKRLRVFNFARGQDASLKISPSNEVIAAHLAPGLSQHTFSRDPGSLTLVMSTKLKNGFEAEQMVEANFTRADSISALVMFDKYGRLELLAKEDGRTD